MKQRDSDIVVGLDIGTTKVCAIVGELSGSGIDIVGIGHACSRGVMRGVVVDIEATVQAIKKAIEEAEIMSGREIREVYAGISGEHIYGINSHGVIAIKDGEVHEADVSRVIDAAWPVHIPQDRELLHIIPQEFIIDGQDGIKEPLGMSGIRLEAKVHIVTGAAATTQNILKCARRSGLEVKDSILGALASAEAVLSHDEKELGVALLDIGGGTSDLAIFHAGSIRYTRVIPLGGNHITNDISVGLRTPRPEADKLKHKYGCAMASLVPQDEMIEVPNIGGKERQSAARQLLADFIEPRAEEILDLVRAEIVKSGYADLLAAGVVLTGGTSLLEGLPELATQIFQLPVRRGVPHYVGGLRDSVGSPIFSTPVGLLLYGARERIGRRPPGGKQAGRGFMGAAQRVGEWLGEFLGL